MRENEISSSVFILLMLILYYTILRFNCNFYLSNISGIRLTCKALDFAHTDQCKILSLCVVNFWSGNRIGSVTLSVSLFLNIIIWISFFPRLFKFIVNVECSNNGSRCSYETPLALVRDAHKIALGISFWKSKKIWIMKEVLNFIFSFDFGSNRWKHYLHLWNFFRLLLSIPLRSVK